VRIEAVATQLARLPLPGGAWGDAIHHVTHIEVIVTDVTTDTGLVGTGFSYTSGSGGMPLKAISITTSHPSSSASRQRHAACGTSAGITCTTWAAAA